MIKKLALHKCARPKSLLSFNSFLTLWDVKMEKYKNVKFCKSESVSVPSKEERDEDYSLNLVLTRLRKFHRQYKKDGKG